jgi:hypothetical protein
MGRRAQQARTRRADGTRRASRLEERTDAGRPARIRNTHYESGAYRRMRPADVPAMIDVPQFSSATPPLLISM